MKNEIPDFKNFSSVWERVEKQDEAPPEMPVCLVKSKEKTRAVRFLPKL